MPASDPYRLPRNVVPDRYVIRIEPDLRNFTFTGEETVEVSVRAPVREIEVNAAELEIPRVSIQDRERDGAR
ncbi:MAG: hypothetical protein ACE5JD_01705 [Candidatus Methylomirabilia bacterium]